jgi:hypothetical protein
MKSLKKIHIIGILFTFTLFLSYDYNSVQPISLEKNSEFQDQILPALEDSPFSFSNLIQDSEFNNDDTWWNYSSSLNLSAGWDSQKKTGTFQHSSPYGNPSYTEQILQQAKYNAAPIKTLLLTANDSQTLKTYQESGISLKLNTDFNSPLNNGDIIRLYFISGNPATINIRNTDSQSNPSYGIGSYMGGIELIDITLSGLSTGLDKFNIDITFEHDWYEAYLDYCAGYTIIPKKSFTQNSTIYQPFSSEYQENLTHSVNFKLKVSDFDAINDAHLYVQINESSIYSLNIKGKIATEIINVSIPKSLLMGRNNFLLQFILSVDVFTTQETKLELIIDSVYVQKSPITNLLEDNDFYSGQPWSSLNTSSEFYGLHDSQNQYYSFQSNPSEPISSDGSIQLKQTFVKNSSQNEFELELKYNVLNLTGIEYFNLSIQINQDYILINKQHTTTISNWKSFKINASEPLLSNGEFTLNITCFVKLQNSPVEVGLSVNFDEINLFPIWGSQLTQVSIFDGNLTSGNNCNLGYYYNTSITGDSIIDAEVEVINNVTGQQWGYDVSSNKKYQIVDYENGTYGITIQSLGYGFGIYNLSITFWHQNFKTTIKSLQLNITGVSATATIINGADYDILNKIWLVDSETTPYVDDPNKELTVYLNDSNSGNPVENAFIESQLGSNTLGFTELYKITSIETDKGIYLLKLNSMGLGIINDYYLLNFSILISANGYSSEEMNVTTKINAIPTTMTISTIEPFYQNAETELIVIYQNSFHSAGVNNAIVTWKLLGTGYQGTLDFLFIGYYSSKVNFLGLSAGNYTVEFTGTATNYQQCISQRVINILPKWQISLTNENPTNLIEGSTIMLKYSMKLANTSISLIHEQINFKIVFNSSNTYLEKQYLTDQQGNVEFLLQIPIGENKISIYANYSGKENITANYLISEIKVVPKQNVVLAILTAQFSERIVGESNLLLKIQVKYQNGTPVSNRKITFQIGESESFGTTDEDGIAEAYIRLPKEGRYAINASIDGAYLFNSASVQWSYEIEITSPDTIAMENRNKLYIYFASGMGIFMFSLVAVNKFILKPKKRDRQKKTISMVKYFDDARNIQLIMVIDNSTGLETYTKSLGDVPVDPTLIAGFLQAITSFGNTLVPQSYKKDSKSQIEPKKGLSKPNRIEKFKLRTTKHKTSSDNSNKHSSTKKIQKLSFHHFKILLVEGKLLKIALLLSKSDSPQIIDSASQFIDLVEFRFQEKINNPDGRLWEDHMIWDLIDDCFKPSLNYNHVLDYQAIQQNKLSKMEMKIINFIKKPPYYGEVFLETIYEELASRNIGLSYEILKICIKLHDSNILFPLSPEFMDDYDLLLLLGEAITDDESLNFIFILIGTGATDIETIQEKSKIDPKLIKKNLAQLTEMELITKYFNLNLRGKVLYNYLITQGSNK